MEKLNYYLKSPNGFLRPLERKMTKIEAQKIANEWSKKYGVKYTIVWYQTEILSLNKEVKNMEKGTYIGRV